MEENKETQGRYKKLLLAVEKFKRPIKYCGNKYYQLIWIEKGEARICENDETQYRTKQQCVDAGWNVIKELELNKLQFDTRTR